MAVCESSENSASSWNAGKPHAWTRKAYLSALIALAIFPFLASVIVSADIPLACFGFFHIRSMWLANLNTELYDHRFGELQLNALNSLFLSSELIVILYVIARVVVSLKIKMFFNSFHVNIFLILMVVLPLTALLSSSERSHGVFLPSYHKTLALNVFIVCWAIMASGLAVGELASQVPALFGLGKRSLEEHSDG